VHIELPTLLEDMEVPATAIAAMRNGMRSQVGARSIVAGPLFGATDAEPVPVAQGEPVWDANGALVVQRRHRGRTRAPPSGLKIARHAKKIAGSPLSSPGRPWPQLFAPKRAYVVGTVVGMKLSIAQKTTNCAGNWRRGWNSNRRLDGQISQQELPAPLQPPHPRRTLGPDDPAVTVLTPRREGELHRLGFAHRRNHATFR
jgi:hypothetical protein